MEKVFKYMGLIILIGITDAVMAQIPDVQNQMEAVIESMTGDVEEETDAALILEDLEDFAQNPLNINTASEEQLSRLHLLNSIQIDKLLQYRNEYGPVLSIYELKSVEGLNTELLMKMEPFIWFGPEEGVPQKFSEILKYGRHEVLLRALGNIQKSKGYLQGEDGTIPFEGNRYRYYNRYRFKSGDDVSAAVIAEKDPGEAFFTKSNPNGFDFYSAHLSLRLSSVVQNITLGDYVVRFGQGLVIWQGFSLGKSLYSTNICKTNQGIRPYTSTDENRFFRGAATTLKAGNSHLTFFFSGKKFDGNKIMTDSVFTHFTSLQTSGYHRTHNEIADEKSVGDINAGASGSWQSGNLKLGIVYLYRQFDLPLIPPDQLYNRFYFRGTRNHVAGADYLFSKGNYQLFGEAAVSKSGGKAALQGATAYLHDRLQLSALFRHFDKDYHAQWATPFAESSSAANETGLYLGTRILPVKYVTLSAYSDMYRSGWLKYTTASPSNGWDVFVQVEYRPSDRFQLYIRYKNEEKDSKFALNEKKISLPGQYIKNRVHIQYSPSEIITLKTRLEHVQYKSRETEKGIMVYQDFQFNPVGFPLNLSARIAWFNTEGYDSRIYAYENDLLYSYAIPAFFGKGFRTYINLKYKLCKNTEVWFKLANTLQNDAVTTGTGLNEIAGNQKTELKIQLRLKI
jgi:hypothetical protein